MMTRTFIHTASLLLTLLILLNNSISAKDASSPLKMEGSIRTLTTPDATQAYDKPKGSVDATSSISSTDASEDFIEIILNRNEDDSNFFPPVLNPSLTQKELGYVDTPLRRFEIEFFISIPITWLLQQVFIEQFNLYFRNIGIPELSQGQRFLYLLVSTTILALGIAMDDYYVVFGKNQKPPTYGEYLWYDSSQGWKILSLPLYSKKF